MAKEVKNEAKEIIVKSSFPICSVTFIVLLILKLFNVVEIGWLWVFAPIWIPIVLFLAVIIIYFIVLAIAVFFAAIFDRK